MFSEEEETFDERTYSSFFFFVCVLKPVEIELSNYFWQLHWIKHMYKMLIICTSIKSMFSDARWGCDMAYTNVAQEPKVRMRSLPDKSWKVLAFLTPFGDFEGEGTTWRRGWIAADGRMLNVWMNSYDNDRSRPLLFFQKTKNKVRCVRSDDDERE